MPRPRLRTGGAAALALLVLLPGAGAAMTLDVVAAPDGPLAPESETGTIQIDATIDCQDLLLMTGGGVPSPETSLTFAAEAPPPVLVTGPASKVVSSADCTADPTGTHLVITEFQVAITRAAPALEPQSLRFEAILHSAGGPTALLGSNNLTADATLAVEADVDLLIDVAVQEKIQQTSGGTVAFPVHITNHGNSPVEVAIDLLEASGDHGTWYQPRGPVAVGRAGGDDAVSEAELRFDVPPAVNRQDTFRFTFTPEFQGRIGEAATVNVVIRTQDHSEAVPAPMPAATLMLLAAAALWTGRGRRP